MLSGIIETFLYTRGFGYIQSGTARYFFHVNNFKNGKAALGARVEFELGEPFKLGMPKQAINVRVIEDPVGTLIGAVGGAE